MPPKATEPYPSGAPSITFKGLGAGRLSPLFLPSSSLPPGSLEPTPRASLARFRFMLETAPGRGGAIMGGSGWREAAREPGGGEQRKWGARGAAPRSIMMMPAWGVTWQLMLHGLPAWDDCC